MYLYFIFLSYSYMLNLYKSFNLSNYVGYYNMIRTQMISHNIISITSSSKQWSSLYLQFLPTNSFYINLMNKIL